MHVHLALKVEGFQVIIKELSYPALENPLGIMHGTFCFIMAMCL